MTSAGSSVQARAREHPKVVALLFSLVAYLFAGHARADDEVPLALDYTAPPGCPGADRFLGDVAARTPLLRRARGDEPAVTLTVVVAEVPGGNKGTLRLASADGTTSARQVSAADCEQVVSALALMTALALDPNASTAPVAKAAPPPEEKPPPPAPVPEKERAAPVVAAESSMRWRLQLGLALEALAGVTPTALVLIRPSVELGSSGASRWSSALRLSVAFGRSSLKQAESGADFDLLVGRVEACPARWRATTAFTLAPCVAVDAGRLSVVGVNVNPTGRVAPPWVAPLLVARIEWRIVDALAAELSGELLFPLTRDRFFIDTDTTLHRTPAVAAGATIGLGARFP